jgi:hypothetical protein
MEQLPLYPPTPFPHASGGKGELNRWFMPGVFLILTVMGLWLAQAILNIPTLKKSHYWC